MSDQNEDLEPSSLLKQSEVGLSQPRSQPDDFYSTGDYDSDNQHVDQKAVEGPTRSNIRSEADEPISYGWPTSGEPIAETKSGEPVDGQAESSSLWPVGSVSDSAAIRSEQNIGENYGTAIGVFQETVRRMVDSHELPARYVSDCVKLFVQSERIDALKNGLRERRVIVLTGTRGSGRHTSAVWLLQNVGGLRLREVRREPGDNFIIDDLASEHHVGWLLDLSADGDQVQNNLGRTLMTSTRLLELASSYLAVVIRPDLWDQVKVGGEDVAVPLIAPSPVEIVHRRLTQAEPAIPESDATRWLQYPEIVHHLESLSPVQAVEWARAIRSEHLTPLHPTEFTIQPDELSDETLAEKAANVIKARSDWRDDLLKWNKTHPDSRARNFMLAAAVLEGSPGEDVFTAAAELAKTLKSNTSEARDLDGPGMLELVSEVDAHLTIMETVCFNRAGYANAVLEYFWVDRMHLREAFISWMNALALNSQGDVTDSIVGRLGQYVLRWSIRRNKIDILEKLITAWAKDRRFIPAAETLIAGAGLDPSLGRIMRDRMLAWARNEQEDSIPLKLMVARACSGPLGQIYPKVMLLRLGYVAGTDDPEVADAVKDAVRALWGLAKARERIRTDIIGWYDSGDATKCSAARRTFTALAALTVPSGGTPLLLAPKELSTEKAQEFLVEGWRCVLDEPVSNDETRRTFAIWVDNAHASQSAQAILWKMFADAVYNLVDEDFNDRRYSTLSDLLYTWQPTGGEATTRTLLRESLLSYVRKLDPLRHPAIWESESTNNSDV
jgi:hypothetical protein